MGQGQQVADDGDRGGMAACAVAGEDDIAAVVAGEDDHVLRAARPGQRGAQIHEHGADGGGHLAAGLLGAGHLADGAGEIAGVTEVDGGDGGDGLGDDLFRIDGDAKGEAHEDRELGAGIEAADVFSGVGLGIASLLRLSQHRGIFRAGFHFAEDEVAGAVEDAFNALDAVAGQALLEGGNDGDSAGHGSAVFEVPAFGSGEPLEFHAMIGNELLVGGDHALAGLEGAADPSACGIEAAGQLDDDIDIRGENRIRVFAPDDAVAGSSQRACG